LYDAWASQSGIEKWFLRSAIFQSPDGKIRGYSESVQPGDLYAWLWHGYSDDIKEQKKVVEANGKYFFQFIFTGDCLVSVKLESQKNQTIVTLVQEKIPDDDNPATNLFVNCQLGWTFYLANLKSVMEGGIDHRNRDIQLEKVVNA